MITELEAIRSLRVAGVCIILGGVFILAVWRLLENGNLFKFKKKSSNNSIVFIYEYVNIIIDIAILEIEKMLDLSNSNEIQNINISELARRTATVFLVDSSVNDMVEIYEESPITEDELSDIIKNIIIENIDTIQEQYQTKVSKLTELDKADITKPEPVKQIKHETTSNEITTMLENFYEDDDYDI